MRWLLKRPKLWREDWEGGQVSENRGRAPRFGPQGPPPPGRRSCARNPRAPPLLALANTADVPCSGASAYRVHQRFHEQLGVGKGVA